MSYSTRVYFLFFLLANASYLVSTKYDHDVTRYCRLCKSHTMCRYPFDDAGAQCHNIDNTDLELEDAEAIVHQHNEYRNLIASGEETRGNPGPQPAAKNMMELIWDAELAKIARRWVIQCIPEKDECRDIDRFDVWQNVHVLDVESLESATSSFNRIPFHVQSWLDDVENFDNAEVGMVDYAKDERGPYIGIASGKITRIGCGRAMYSENVQQPEMIERKMTQMRNKTTPARSSSKNIHSSATTTTGSTTTSTTTTTTTSSSSSRQHLTSAPHHRRLEVLVCNYGPIDRTTPENLYEDGMPGQCPTGFDTSQHYEYLCKVKDDDTDERWDNNPSNVRSSSNTVRYCVWTSFILSQLCQSFVNAVLSSQW